MSRQSHQSWLLLLVLRRQDVATVRLWNSFGINHAMGEHMRVIFRVLKEGRYQPKKLLKNVVNMHHITHNCNIWWKCLPRWNKTAPFLSSVLITIWGKGFTIIHRRNTPARRRRITDTTMTTWKFHWKPDLKLWNVHNFLFFLSSKNFPADTSR